MRIIGIDPGKTGGIVTFTEGEDWSGGLLLDVMPVIKSSGRDVLDISEIRRILWKSARFADTRVFIEKQQPLPPKMGGGNANFQRGYHLGVLEGLCHALKLSYDIVAPIRWQRLILADVVGDDTKQRAVLAADRLFPGVDLRVGRGRKPHGGLVDALLIAEYGRRRMAVRDV